MNRGFSTLELLLALVIITTTLAAVALVSFGIPQALESGKMQEEATESASALLEKELQIGTYSFPEVTSLATTTENGFESGLVSTVLPDGTSKKLVSTAKWIDANGATQYVTLSGVVIDYQDISTNGSCDSVLSGDWTKPQSISYPLSSSAITALALSTSTLVAVVSSSTTRTEPTVFMFSLASSTHPVQIGSIDTATSTKYGETSVTTNGSTVYTTSAYPSNFATCSTGPTCSQLQIIDATNPGAPLVASYFQLATSSGPHATGSGGQSIGKTLFYRDGLLYVGLQKTGAASGGDEFDIINVHDPRAPVWLGGYSVGRSVNQIQVQNGIAYLATDDPSQELLELDVHDPYHPSFLNSYDAPGSSIFGYGESVAVSGGTASTTVVLGRSFTYNGPGMSILSGSTAIGSTTESSSIVGIMLQSFLAFVLTATQLEFWNLSNPAHPTTYDKLMLLPNMSTAVPGALVCRHSTLYVASIDAAHVGYLTVITGS